MTRYATFARLISAAMGLLAAVQTLRDAYAQAVVWALLAVANAVLAVSYAVEHRDGDQR